MKIVPTNSNFTSWLKCVPTDGDLIFLTKKEIKLFEKLRLPILTCAEALAANGNLVWQLNSRSWYGYALMRASHCSLLLPGTLEALSHKDREQMAQAQIRLGVPTLVRRLSVRRLPKVSHYSWITSSVWPTLSRAQQLMVFKAWWRQNKVEHYSSFAYSSPSRHTQRSIERAGLSKVINTFANCSGPNCFAAVASAVAIQEEKTQDIRDQWLHWEPFQDHLDTLGYTEIRSKEIQVGDVLILWQKSNPVHAAFAVGDNIIFEKPGQDFYEPYRMQKLAKWKSEWPGTTLKVWRAGKAV